MRAPPEAANMMNGVSFSTAVSSPVTTASPGRHAERAAHEIEVLHRDHHRQAVELAVGRA